MDELTPKQIVHELDRYIIWQHEAKKAVAIALRNRYRRAKLPEEIKEEIMDYFQDMKDFYKQVLEEDGNVLVTIY